MVRSITDTNERKQPVSVSLTALEIVMLNNLAKDAKMNRSRVLASLIRDHSFKELGLSAIEAHLRPIQQWKPKGVYTNRKEDPGACNPHGYEGPCQHSHCRALYAQWGL